MPQYLQPALDRVAARAPDVFASLRFHETGGPAPSLDGVRAVVFWLGDPLRESYPVCHAEAAAIAADARARGARLINPPETLSNSIKSVQARLWRDAGIPTPRHVPFADRAELDAALATMPYPVVIKADRLHSQRRMRVWRSAADAAAAGQRDIAYPGAVAELVDTRDGWATRAPGSPWAVLHHKKRVLVLGDRVLPRHVFFSTNPIVGYDTSNLARYYGMPRMLARVLPYLRPRDRAVLAADYAFAHSAPAQPDLLRRAAHVLGFEWAAIDYATRGDGTLVLWEANPYFAMPGPSNYTLPGVRRFEERFTAFCDAVAEFFRSLAA